MMNDRTSWPLRRGVFTQDATFVGKVIGVRTDPQNRPTMLTQLDSKTAVEIGWESVAGGKDILVLKAGFDREKAKKYALPLTDATKQGWYVGSIPAEQKKQEGQPPTCPTCGNKASWIGEYGRWYCRNERKYL